MAEALTSDYWNERYQQGNTGWDRGAPSPALDQWLQAREHPPASVLVPGCGAGHEVIELARRGIAVTGLDYAPRAIAKVRARLSGQPAQQIRVDLVEADLFEFQPATPFAAVYEQTCLCAIAPERRLDYQRRLHSWLEPGGELMLLAMQTGRPGQGPPFHCDVADLRQLFRDDQWHWPEEPPLRLEHPGGPIFELGFCLRRR